jgi:hypothetical protein
VLPFLLLIPEYRHGDLMRCFPDSRPFWGAALATSVMLTTAVLRRSPALAMMSAVTIPIVAASLWYAYSILWNAEAATLHARDGSRMLWDHVAWWSRQVGVPLFAGAALCLVVALRAIRSERNALEPT